MWVLCSCIFMQPTHKAECRNKITQPSTKENSGIFVTEYGICDASGNGAIDKKEADRWIQDDGLNTVVSYISVI